MALLAMVCLVNSVEPLMAQQVYTSSGAKSTAKKKEGFKWSTDNIVFGSGLGIAGFSSNLTSFTISPLVGYRFFNRFAAGIGFGYRYYKEKNALRYIDPNTQIEHYFDYKEQVMSPSVWVRYAPLRYLFLHAEYEHNLVKYVDYRYNSFNNVEAFNVKLTSPALLMGPGLRLPT